MHIKNIIIHGFKAIRNLSFDGTFHPGHNVISECCTLLACRACATAQRKLRPTRAPAPLAMCPPQSALTATASPQSSMVSRKGQPCKQVTGRRRVWMCCLKTAAGSAPRRRQSSAGRPFLKTCTIYLRAPLLFLHLSLAAIRFALSDGPAVAANGTRAGLLWVSQAVLPNAVAPRNVPGALSVELAGQNWLQRSLGAAARRRGVPLNARRAQSLCAQALCRAAATPSLPRPFPNELLYSLRHSKTLAAVPPRRT